MPAIQAKDLSKEFPRSPYEELGGFPWLPRMIDKVRALNAGTLHDYVPFPCGGDKRFLGTLEVDPEAIKAVIVGGATDEEVLAWVKANATPGVEERIQGYRAASFQPAPSPVAEYLEGAKAELKAARPELDLSQVVNFAQFICLEEGYPIPVAR